MPQGAHEIAVYKIREGFVRNKYVYDDAKPDQALWRLTDHEWRAFELLWTSAGAICNYESLWRCIHPNPKTQPPSDQEKLNNGVQQVVSDLGRKIDRQAREQGETHIEVIDGEGYK